MVDSNSTTTVTKESETQSTIELLLSGTAYPANASWKVYEDDLVNAGKMVVSTAMTASYNNSTNQLTLSSAVTGIPAKTYYVTVTEEGGAESAPLSVIVKEDTTAPTGTIKVGNEYLFTTFSDVASYKYFYKNAEQATIVAEDSVATVTSKR